MCFSDLFLLQGIEVVVVVPVLRQLFAAKDEVIAAKNGKLAAKDRELKRADEVIAAKDGQLAEKEARRAAEVDKVRGQLSGARI